jgi:tRNA A-37 threonylcarbamoyl transferase component Bud32
MQETIVNNRYSIVRILGSGGMARVYLAHDEVLDRDVALKVLREQFAEDEEFVERFKREAQSAAALSHPNIVQVYDRGKAEDGASYIAMEYVPGGTLKERISRSGPLDPGVVLSIALQITEALQAAHERGVIHRDIKPHNVLLTPSGDAKVTDFGIARAVSATTISQRNMVLGTASYMSPEQAMGEPATPKSDLYSLGVVLYEMLTGELPYAAESPVAVSMKHLNEPLRPPKEVNPRIPQGMNTVVVKLLAKDPKDRYADAAELAEDLRRTRDELVLIAAGGATGTTRVAPQATAPVSPAAATKSWRRTPWTLVTILGLLVLLSGVSWALLQGFPGLGSVLVPDVKGLAEEQARQRLTTAGFEVDVRHQESSAADAGRVLEQSPAAGERAEKGSRVVITVGNGPSTVEVPEVIGLSLSEAEATLDEADLTVGQRREIPSDTAPEGVVIEQGLSAGTKVKPGTPVNLGISSGPQQAAQTAPATATASSSATATASPSATATASPSAPAEEAEEIDEDNSGPGSDNSGSGSSGSGGD